MRIYNVLLVKLSTRHRKGVGLEEACPMAAGMDVNENKSPVKDKNVRQGLLSD